MPTTPVVTDWGTAIMSSVATALALLLGGIPKIIGFLVVLLVGWLIAGAVAGAVAAILRAVKFNELAPSPDPRRPCGVPLCLSGRTPSCPPRPS